MRSVLAGMAALLLAPAAQAADFVTAGGYPACLSEDNFHEAVEALSKSDMEWFASLPGCIITKPGIEMTVVDYGFLGTSKVRLHPDGGGRPITVYTNSENVKSR